jgi:glycosyltransferase involved in cell wall biosynthesis
MHYSRKLFNNLNLVKIHIISIGGDLITSQNERIAFVLLGGHTGGTQRRIGNLFKFLSDRYPGKYHLIINEELYEHLQKANYRLDQYHNIHIIKGKSKLDFKKGAHASVLVNFGRVFTLFHYRKEVKRIINEQNITTIQVFLEMVPFLGVFPINGVKKIASLVMHLPKYYDKNNLNCKLLLHALQNYDKIDGLYEYIGDSLIQLGVPQEKVNYPKRNFVNHIQYKPEKKKRSVTFSARLVNWKNPLLLLDAILKTLPYVDDDIEFYIMGRGKLLKQIQNKIKSKGLEDRIKANYVSDPSLIVNKSLIHISIETYDNFTNQSLLEGMASGCAIISSDVGLTNKVVTPDVGILVELSAQEISDAIKHLMKHPYLIKKMGQNAREKIIREHTIDKYADYITKLQDFDSPFYLTNGREIKINPELL